jgi:cytochrome c-type biogenesis protein CcmH
VVTSALALFIVAAVLCAASSAWVLRAYYRAAGGGEAPAQPAFIAALLVTFAALGVYIALGSPNLPDAPFAARLEALKQRDPTTFTGEEALAILQQAAREQPDDPTPLLYAGQVYMQLEDAEGAARSFEAALRRDPDSVEAMLGLGRAMVARDNGQVSPEALQLFERMGALSDDPTPWVYQAMAAMQQDRAADTAHLWGEALRRMAADDPRRVMAARMASGATDAAP